MKKLKKLPPFIHPTEVHNAAAGKKVAIVIDDDVSVCEVVRILLEEMGIIAICKRTSGEVYDILHTITPNLFFMDYWLSGGVNGYELSKWIRTETDFKDVPIVFMTAYDEAPKGISELKRTHILKKPFDIDAFTNLVSEILSKGE